MSKIGFRIGQNLIIKATYDISAMCVWHFGTFGVLDHPLVLNWDLLAHTFNLGVAVGSSAILTKDAHCSPEFHNHKS